MRRRMDAYLEPLVEPERLALYQAVCEFADNEIAPELLTWERQHCLLPTKTIRAIADVGLFGFTVTDEYNKQNGTQIDLVLIGLALGYHSQSVAITPGTATSLSIKPLQLCEREDQKRTHLPDLAAEKRM